MFANRKITLCIFVVYALVFSLISFGNHYYFRSNTFDLGYVNNAAYHFTHLQNSYSVLLLEGGDYFLASHFSLWSIILSPFYYIFSSYSYLIFQIVFILFGGLGIYKIVENEKPGWGNIFLIHFFSIWGIYSTLSFDFHDNVIGAMFLPWILYFFKKEHLKLCFLCFLGLIISKENMALWAIFISLFLFFNAKGKSDNKRFALMIGVFASFYYYVVTSFIIPSISANHSFTQFLRYAHLGGSPFEIIKNVLSHPEKWIDLLFINNSGTHFGNFAKLEFHVMFLLSGGIFCFFRPMYLLLLIPLHAQKFLSNTFGLWGINGQYSIEFVPILTLVFFDFCKNFKPIEKSRIIKCTFLVFTIALTIITFQFRYSNWFNSEKFHFYKSKFYSSKVLTKEVYKLMDKIPSDAIISVQDAFLPHLAFRQCIYLYPVVLNANYILTVKGNADYPCKNGNCEEVFNGLKKSKEFFIKDSVDNVFLFQRINPIINDESIIK